MHKILSLVALVLLPGCYAAHAPAQDDPETCTVEWVCTGILDDDGVCEGLMVGIDPCHSAPEPEECPGTYTRDGSGYVFVPDDGRDCRPTIR